MNIIKNDKVVFFDVDFTIIDWNKPEFDYYDNVVIDGKTFYPIQKTINLLKVQHSQGFRICVHSSGGWSWCEKVIKALELEKYVDDVYTKPKYYVDDESMDKWSFRLIPKELK